MGWPNRSIRRLNQRIEWGDQTWGFSSVSVSLSAPQYFSWGAMSHPMKICHFTMKHVCLLNWTCTWYLVPQKNWETHARFFWLFFSQKVRCCCVLQNDATHQVPGNCLPGAGANLYVGLTDSWETLQATWSLNHVHLELFVEVSQHIQVEQVGPLVQGFFKSDGPTFGVAVKTLLGHLMVWRCTWTGDCQVHLYKDILMIFPLQNIKIIQIYCFWLRFFMIFPYISTTKHQIEWLT